MKYVVALAALLLSAFPLLPAAPATFCSQHSLAKQTPDSEPTAEEMNLLERASLQPEYSLDDLLNFWYQEAITLEPISGGHRLTIDDGGGIIVIDIIDDL